MKYIDVAIKAAQKAGSIIRKASSEAQSYSFKSTYDIVTAVDLASEQAIISTIKKEFPSHSIMAEESGIAIRDSDFLWIIDPLDGTINFTQGLKEYSISIALQHKNQTIAAVVYQPITKELFVAEKSKGAYYNGKRMAVSKTTKLINAVIATDNSSKLPARKENFDTLVRLLPQIRQVRIFGGTVLHLARTAAGQIDGHYKVHTNFWDIAAGSLLITEAGGRVTDFSGQKVSAETYTIASGNPAIHRQLKSAINA